ncbi:uncharacterized protein [Lolium perenne]|uniref:uncharacterized protein n=2 Tax=Lolium perenne TaxID=4522 RepID=UPI0021F68248|nr:uncharacterized protein LOC127326469 [Lolium perenne]
MRKEIIIRMYVSSEKCQAKAMKVAATASGVESVTLAGGDKSLLLVIGDDVDSNKLTKKLIKKVGSAEIVELRTLDTFDMSSISHHAVATKGGASPYHGQHQYHQYQYAAAPMSPYAYHHHPSPMMAVQGGYGNYGSSYARAVAHSHPGNYSPLVERHDYYPMDKSASRLAAAGGPGAGVTTYRSVPRRDSDSSSGGCCIQ